MERQDIKRVNKSIGDLTLGHKLYKYNTYIYMFFYYAYRV